MKAGRKSLPIRDRIEENIERITESGCWIWMRAVDEDGYGRIKVKNSNRGAHKRSYEEFVGPVPDGIFVCHRCDIPSCVNPHHLFLGTNRENLEDRDRKGRQARRESHGNSKLSNQLASEIRKLRSEGASLKDLSREFGLRVATVCMVAKGRIWSDDNPKEASWKGHL
jgi:HNH endonuclease